MHKNYVRKEWYILFCKCQRGILFHKNKHTDALAIETIRTSRPWKAYKVILRVIWFANFLWVRNLHQTFNWRNEVIAISGVISDVELRNCTVMYFALQWWKQRNNNPPAIPSCSEVQSSKNSELHKVLSRRVFRSKKCSVFMQIQILQDISSSDWIIMCMRKTKLHLAMV